MNSKKHHYIPRFYLKGFTNDRSSFYVYDKKIGKMWLSNPDSAFTENHRNTSVMEHLETKEVMRTDLPEEMLAYFDNKAAKVIQEVRNSKPEEIFFTPERLHEIKLFIMTTFWRTPANDHLREDIIAKSTFEDLGFGFYDKDGVRNEEIEALIKDTDLWRKTYPALLPISGTLKKNNETKNDQWRIAYRTSNIHLVTDNPIILKEYSGFGSFQKDLIAPLTSKHLLIVTEKISANSLAPVFSLQTDLLLYHRATRYVASADESYLKFIVDESTKLNNPGWENLLLESIFGHFN